MNTLIIEDEQLAAQRLIRQLKEINTTINILCILKSVEETLNWLQANPLPDIIFMDIQLEDGICFEIFETNNIHVPIIFTTAYDEYALKAFKVNSVDYLLKPIAVDELRASILKLHHLHHKIVNNETKLDSLVKQLQPQIKERFLIKIGAHYKSIATTEIHCFYILERSVFILTETGKSYPVDYSLENIERLVDSKIFFRINRNFIINMNAICDILIYSTNRLKITLQYWKGKEEMIISRERVADFKKWMDQ